MSEHSKQSLRLGSAGFMAPMKDVTFNSELNIVAEGPGMVSYIAHMGTNGDVAGRLADASRLVACWNACTGIETETLELSDPRKVREVLYGQVEARATEAERLLADARELVDGLVWVIEGLTDIVAGDPEHDVPTVANAHLHLRAARAFLDGAKPKVKLGDEVEPQENGK
jgi:hypothetical protein